MLRYMTLFKYLNEKFLCTCELKHYIYKTYTNIINFIKFIIDKKIIELKREINNDI
jgi:hypothetical protein